MIRKLLLAVPIAILAAVLQACGGDGPTDPKPAPQLALSAVSTLTPGAAASVTGTKLSDLSSLSVGGQTVAFTRVSETEVRFTVPKMRDCEVDGRSVQVAANSGAATITGTVHLQDVRRLQVGESQVLGAADLACLQLSREAGTYLLSVVSLRTDVVIDTVFHLTARGAAAGSAPSASSSASLAPEAFGALSAEHASHLGAYLPAGAPAARAASGSIEGDFDPKYATAQVGDTLTFADWGKAETYTATTRETTPSHQAVVVAIGGKTVIVVDTRLPNAANFMTPAVQQKMKRAAEIADSYSLPAARAVINPDFQPMHGGGGRVFAIVTTVSGGVGTVGNSDYGPKRKWPASSEMIRMLLTAGFDNPGADASSVASTIIHEYAHIVDSWPYAWDVGGRSAALWYTEALAVNATEMAARLFLQEETQADASKLTGNDLRVFGLSEWPSSVAHRESPFGQVGLKNSASGGSYDVGARMLLFAREQMGEAGFSPSGPTLHQRLVQKAAAMGFHDRHKAFSIEAIAQEAGMGATEFIDRYTMAELTDDLVPDAAALKYKLDPIQSWDNTRSLETREDFFKVAGGPRAEWHLLWRTEDREAVGQVPSGGHHYWFIPTDPGKGISIEARAVKLAPYHKVRLTRIR